MHQQSSKDNPSSETRGAEAEEVADLDIDLDADLASFSLPSFLSSFTAETADDDDSMGAFASTLADSVFGDSAEHDTPTLSQTENAVEPSYYEETLYTLLASFPAAEENLPSPVATTGVPSAERANDTPVESMRLAGLDDVVGNETVALGQGLTAPDSPHPRAEMQDDVAKRIAQLIRLVASVASRNVIIDDAHQPLPGTTEYDPRHLLAAAYDALTTWGPRSRYPELTKGAFGKIAGNASHNNFIVWSAYFRGGLDADLRRSAIAWWTSLGIGDARDAKAVLDQLNALVGEGAPVPTRQDLVDSPLYRKLAFTKITQRMMAQRNKEKRSNQDDTSDNTTLLGAVPALPALAHRGDALAGIRQGVSGSGDPRRAAETVDDAARRIAHLIRIVGSVANRDLQPDASHQPQAGQIQYHPGDLLIAAHRLLAEGSRAILHMRSFPMSLFSGLAGDIPVRRVEKWNARYRPRQTGPRDFWASVGLGDGSAVGATIGALKAMKEKPDAVPTLQALEASPLYKKLTLLPPWGTRGKRRSANEIQSDNASAANDQSMEAPAAQSVENIFGADGEQGVQAVPSFSQSEDQAGPSDYETSFENLFAAFPFAAESPQSSVASSLRRGRDGGDALADTRVGADVGTTSDDIDAGIGQEVAGSRRLHGPVETQRDLGRRIADMIRLVAGVAKRVLRPGDAAQPPAGSIEYDSRYLLAAAYKLLTKWGPDASPIQLQQGLFGKLAGGIASDTFGIWNRHVEGAMDADRRREAFEFWASIGLRSGRGAQSVIDQLKSLANDAAPAPTLQDLAESPLHRKLTLTSRSAYLGNKRSRAKRAQQNEAPGVLPTATPRRPMPTLFSSAPAPSARGVASILPRGNAPGAAPVFQPDWPTDVAAPGTYAVSYNALGASTQSRPDAPLTAAGENDGLADSAPVTRQGRATRRLAQDVSDSGSHRVLRQRLPTSARTLPPPQVATVSRAPLPLSSGVASTLVHGESAGAPSALLPDWSLDLAPWSQTAVATEVLDTQGGDSHSWSDAAPGSMHSGETTLTLLSTTGLQDVAGGSGAVVDADVDRRNTDVVQRKRAMGPAGADTSQEPVKRVFRRRPRPPARSLLLPQAPRSSTRLAARARGLESTVLPMDSAGPQAMLLPDWPHDDMTRPPIPAAVDASDSDVSRYADSAVPQSGSDVSRRTAVSTAFDLTSRLCPTDGSTSDYAPSTASHSTPSSRGTLPSVTTIAPGSQMPPALAVPPGTFVFEHGLTRITGGPGVDMTLVLEMVRAALAAPQPVPEPPPGANPP